MKHNPIDRLAPLAKAKVPIFHIHGDMDRVVPLDKNSAIIKQRYDALGGRMTLEVVKGKATTCGRLVPKPGLVDFSQARDPKGRHERRCFVLGAVLALRCQARRAAGFDSVVSVFFKANCVKCHGPEKPRAS